MSDQPLSVVPAPEPKTPTAGFRGPVQWRVIVAADGTEFAGFWAEIRVLSDVERGALEVNQTRYDASSLMAPWIKSWNYEVAVETEVTLPAETVTNPDGSEVFLPERTAIRAEYVPLAPPIEAGPRVLDQVDGETWGWLRIHLCGGPVRLLRRKGAGAQPEQAPEDAATTDADPSDQYAAPTPIKKTRAPRPSTKKR